MWIFKLSASINDTEAVAGIRKTAIQQAEELNGNMPKAGTVTDLISRYFNWQTSMKPGDLRKKAKSTLDENLRESQNLNKVFGSLLPTAIKTKHVYNSKWVDNHLDTVDGLLRG